MTIRNPTVLILGAGSSAHCGYPLGMQLISEIAREAQDEFPTIDLPECWTTDHFERFGTRLAQSGHYSIDAFLENSPADIDLGKYIIASLLKRREHVSNLFPPHDSGWYQYLFNCLLNEAGEPFSDNQLIIITFNYDRSLEAYLYCALISRFNMSPSEAEVQLAKIPIIHVHGSIGAFPEMPYTHYPAETYEIHRISSMIKIIHEIQDNEGDFCSEDFSLANASIKNAKKIVFLGFGFHFDNVRRLNVDWSTLDSPEIYSTFVGVTPQEHKQMVLRLSSLGFSSEIFPNWTGRGCAEIFRYDTFLD